MKQKGFTLIEVMVAVAVGGILMAGILGTIHQVVLGTGRSSSQVVALTEVNRAALQIRKDLQMAQNTDLFDGSPAQNSLELDWTDLTGFVEVSANRTHESSYSLSGTDLLRTYDEEVSVAGRNITYIGFTTQDGRLVKVVITATGQRVPPRSETLEFAVYLRSQGM